MLQLKWLVSAAGAAAVAAALTTWFSIQAAAPAPVLLKSGVRSSSDAQPVEADWGRMLKYFTGETAGIKDVLVATATLKPGKAIHRVHRHAEEEFVFVVEGSGTWHLAGKEFPAKRGDVLYVEPWVDHGITNGDSGPMTWAVVRFSSKGAPAAK